MDWRVNLSICLLQQAQKPFISHTSARFKLTMLGVGAINLVRHIPF